MDKRSSKEKHHVVADDWIAKEFMNKEEATSYLNRNKSRFMYRTFIEIDENGLGSTTGKIDFFQNGNRTQHLSFNEWQTVNLDTRGVPFLLKDPEGEIIRHDGGQDELEETYGIKWLEGESYISFVAKILFELSQHNNWDSHKKCTN